MEFKELVGSLTEIQRRVDVELSCLLPREDCAPPRIHQAMRYSIFAGGKRLRPFLVWLGAQAAGGRIDDRRVFAVGAALEMIHTYTLIHDDLPCMDDDDLRRGKPTCHKQFDEATAVLAGDALYAQAFVVLAESANLPVIKLIADMSGSCGIVGGQIMDIAAEGQSVTPEMLEYIHTHKTALFISSSLQAGAMLIDPDHFMIPCLKEYGDRIGLAFQIVDDILDITSSEEMLGKPIGSDVGLNKATYPALFGLEISRQKAQNLIAEALEIVRRDQLSPQIIYTQLAQYFIERQH